MHTKTKLSKVTTEHFVSDLLEFFPVLILSDFLKHLTLPSKPPSWLFMKPLLSALLHSSQPPLPALRHIHPFPCLWSLASTPCTVLLIRAPKHVSFQFSYPSLYPSYHFPSSGPTTFCLNFGSSLQNDIPAHSCVRLHSTIHTAARVTFLIRSSLSDTSGIMPMLHTTIH